MFNFLFGIPFLGSFITIITPAIKGIVEGFVAWIKAMWHGVTTSNYGTWTLLISACAAVWLWKTCPECPSCATPKDKSVIGKTSTSTNANDTFLDWFRLH